jgi:cytochrome c biogenesis protein CcdA/thiol-disulfide isomerase/thioredoxin
MSLALLAYAAGLLTVFSPCVLPVLPLLLAGAGAPFLRRGLPMLLGMALAFAAAASLAAVGGGWAVQAHGTARWIALALVAAFALALLAPGWGERLAAPLVQWGNRLAEWRGGPLSLGLAIGLLWAPCAGPVLGLVLTGAALQGPNPATSLQLLAYALGAATAMAVPLAGGARLRHLAARSLTAARRLRQATGAAVLLAVATIATGADVRVLSRVSAPGTAALERPLLTAWESATRAPAQATGFEGATAWINSPPLDPQDLRGRVVLVHFWTYSCINCLRALPYLRAWHDKYADAGLRIVGVHSPEFAFEKDLGHVRRAVRELGVRHPVAVDNGFAIWRSFGNRAWPALYLIDGQGRLQQQVDGEGRYQETERRIQQLLAAAKGSQPTDLVAPQGSGTQAASPGRVRSGETYVGYERATGFVPPRGLVAGRPHRYAPGQPGLNQWTLAGAWTVESERAVADAAGSRIALRFHARDLHLVLGRAEGAAPVRFRVRIDGKPPGAGHGTDIDADGVGQVDAHRLYQLVRLADEGGEHLFEIEFLDPGAHAYAFTFG